MVASELRARFLLVRSHDAFISHELMIDEVPLKPTGWDLMTEKRRVEMKEGGRTRWRVETTTWENGTGETEDDGDSEENVMSTNERGGNGRKERRMETWTSFSTPLILYTTSAGDFENCPEVAHVVDRTLVKRVVNAKRIIMTEAKTLRKEPKRTRVKSGFFGSQVHFSSSATISVFTLKNYLL